MVLSVSTCGVMYWRSGKLVWDDYLGQHQHALSEKAESVIRWFAHWRRLESLRELAKDEAEFETLHHVAVELHNAEILIAQGSPRHQKEQEVLQIWGEWGALARAFHFSTRFRADDRFMPATEDRVRLTAKSDTEPPPPAFTQFPEAERVPLPELDPSWQQRDLLSVLQSRRSAREYGSAALPLPQLAAILRTTFAASALHGKQPSKFHTVFKTSPSGGGRHPTEGYVVARDVAGLAAGVYHYNGLIDQLEWIAPAPSAAELTLICGDQAWVAQAQAALFYTSVVERHLWKYSSPRGYRVLFLDAGHLNQTVALLATALGLRSTFTAAIRDELAEQLLGCDPSREFVIGCATLGTTQPAVSS